VGSVGTIATAIADPLLAASNVTLVLRSPTPAEHLPEWDGVIDVKQDFPEGSVRHAGAIDLRRAGYLQLATFIALAAAWPSRRRRRGAAAACVAFAVVSMVIAVPVLDFLAGIGAVHLGACLGTATSLARRALVAAPGMAYALPGLVWLAVAQSERTPGSIWGPAEQRSAHTRATGG
jgi:hypothetical protein